MKIYKAEPRFNPRTGERTGDHQVFDHIRCDFTGKVIDDDCEPDFYSYPAYKVDYGNQDPCWGCGDGELEFGREFKVELHVFLNATYHINFADETAFLRFAAAEGFLGDAFRGARIRTAKRLLAEGTIKPGQLEGAECD